MFEQGAEGFEKTLGLEHADTVQLQENLAAATREINGNNHVNKDEGEDDDLKSIENLAASYNDDGDYKNAIKQYKILIGLQENQLGSEAHDTLLSVNNLGLAYYNIGDYAQAKILFEQAAEGLEETLGRDHADTVQLLKNVDAAENQIN